MEGEIAWNVVGGSSLNLASMVLGTSRCCRVPLPFFKASAVRVADACSKDSRPQPPFKIRYILPF